MPEADLLASNHHSAPQLLISRREALQAKETAEVFTPRLPHPEFAGHKLRSVGVQSLKLGAGVAVEDQEAGTTFVET